MPRSAQYSFSSPMVLGCWMRRGVSFTKWGFSAPQLVQNF